MIDHRNAIEFSVRSSDYVQDPYSAYRVLRELDPVHFSKDGYWFLTKFEDVSAALKDLRLRNTPAPVSLLNRKNIGKYLAADVANRMIAFLDPPEHAIPRRIISTSFQNFITGKSRMVEIAAQNCVEAIRKKKEVDFVNDFSIPYSTRCIAEIFGFGPEPTYMLPYWADAIFHLFHSFPSRDVFRQVNDAIREFREFMLSRLHECKKSPGDDLLTKIIGAQYQNSKLDDDQIIDNAMLVCADAIGNVHNGLTTAVLTLLSHEDIADQLKKSPDLIASAVDECLRFESPAQYQSRIAGEDMEIKGRKIRKHSVVLLALGSANRDPDFVDDPDRFDICRPKTTNLSFGLGPHRCIGLGLVKMGFECALRQLFKSDIELNLVEQEIKWIARAGHRWPHSLKINIQ